MKCEGKIKTSIFIVFDLFKDEFIQNNNSQNIFKYTYITYFQSICNDLYLSIYIHTRKCIL